ncbi:MAG: 8-oxoguanine DNA glycosylase, partial [Firmicutes bacterium]|nr:8-oxoguanine DNA glycosylase [Bacillota bacterium]
GPKVESCIRLFGMHDLKSFPIDVWVKRLMNRFYGFDEKDKNGMDRFAEEHFGEYAGLAQQYLFYYIRCLDSSGK